MSIVLLESFSRYNAFADGSRKWSFDHSGAANNTTIGVGEGPGTFPGGRQRRPYPNCLKWDGAYGYGTEMDAYTAFPATDEVIIGFNLRVDGIFEAAPHNETRFLSINNSLNPNYTHCYLRLEHDYADGPDPDKCFLSLITGFTELEDGTQYGISSYGDWEPYAFLIGQWYYVELYYKISNSVGAFELRVDGELRASGSGLDTTTDPTYTTADQLHIEANVSYPSSTYGSGTAFSIADLWVVDKTIGSQHVDFLYPAVIDTLYVDAESAQIDFTPQTGADNSDMVDDSTQHDYDTTYNESTTATDKDRFTVTGPVPDSPLGIIEAVQVSAIVKDTADTGAREARCVISENGTEGNGDTVTLTESGWQDLSAIFPQNPDTTAAWNVDEVENAEIGYEIVT